MDRELPQTQTTRPLRIAYLAAGAAGMYCGSCLRDNRLAATLLAHGRDVTLIPLYTPLKTDETDVSQRTLFYGGISVYLEQRFRLFRGLPAGFGRLLDAPALLRRVLRWSTNVRPEDLGPLTVSVLRGEHGAQKREAMKLIEGLRVLRPSLVHLPNLPFVGIARLIRRELRVPVLCTLSGEDVFLDALPEPFRTQAFDLIREGSEHLDGLVAVTGYYARFAAGHFGIPAAKIHLVPMGIAVDDFRERGELSEPPFVIGHLARICPAKGLHNLCEALIRLRREGRDCRVVAAGYLSPQDQPYLDGVRRRLRAAGMEDAFEYLGEISRERKIEMLRSVHVFSVPTVYHEAKGLYVLEALAAGVPVVQPAHGSFPELIEATGGGLLYDPGDTDRAEPAESDGRASAGESGGVGRLAEGLARLMDDRELRRRLGEAGRAAVREKFTDAAMAETTWALYEKYCAAAGLPGTTGVGPAVAGTEA